MSSPNNYDSIKSITSLLSEDLPSLPEITPTNISPATTTSSNGTSSIISFFSSITCI